MGVGEDVQWEFWKWFSRLDDADADHYMKKYPEPEAWRGKYAEYRADPWDGENG